MPIYQYYCKNCGEKFERIERVCSETWETLKTKTVYCIVCKQKTAVKGVSSFKIGTKVLETTGKSGYQDEHLTLGKIIDEGGIPYEEKNRLRERDAMIGRQKEYTKGLKKREKKYGFNAFS